MEHFANQNECIFINPEKIKLVRKIKQKGGANRYENHSLKVIVKIKKFQNLEEIY